MVKMAAGEENQQGHRAGVYKQKNKGHKHGKHRTKGEIEKDNKGEPCRRRSGGLLLRCDAWRGSGGALTSHVFTLPVLWIKLLH